MIVPGRVIDILNYIYIGCGPPSQDASDHQDYHMFRFGDSYKPSFATVTGRWPDPKYTHISHILNNSISYHIIYLL